MRWISSSLCWVRYRVPAVLHAASGRSVVGLWGRQLPCSPSFCLGSWAEILFSPWAVGSGVEGHLRGLWWYDPLTYVTSLSSFQQWGNRYKCFSWCICKTNQDRPGIRTLVPRLLLLAELQKGPARTPAHVPVFSCFLNTLFPKGFEEQPACGGAWDSGELWPGLWAPVPFGVSCTLSQGSAFMLFIMSIMFCGF